MKFKKETNFIGMMFLVLMLYLVVGLIQNPTSITGAVSGLESISGFQAACAGETGTWDESTGVITLTNECVSLNNVKDSTSGNLPTTGFVQLVGDQNYHNRNSIPESLRIPDGSVVPVIFVSGRYYVRGSDGGATDIRIRISNGVVFRSEDSSFPDNQAFHYVDTLQVVSGDRTVLTFLAESAPRRTGPRIVLPVGSSEITLGSIRGPNGLSPYGPGTIITVTETGTEFELIRMRGQNLVVRASDGSTREFTPIDLAQRLTITTPVYVDGTTATDQDGNSYTFDGVGWVGAGGERIQVNTNNYQKFIDALTGQSREEVERERAERLEGAIIACVTTGGVQSCGRVTPDGDDTIDQAIAALELAGADVAEGLSSREISILNTFRGHRIRYIDGNVEILISETTSEDKTERETLTIVDNGETRTYTTIEDGKIIRQSSITESIDSGGNEFRTRRIYLPDDEGDIDENRYEEITTNKLTSEPTGVTILGEGGNRISAQFAIGGCFSSDAGSDAAIDLCNKRHRQWTSRTYFYRFFEAFFTEFRGIGFIPSLFVNHFVGDDYLEGLREKVDKFFAENYLGREYWESAICNANVRFASERVAFIDTRSGLASVGAHVEASKNIFPAVPELGEGKKILYKITFNVKNGDFQQDPKAIEALHFNLELRGERTIKVYKQDFNAGRGSSVGRFGLNAFRQFSTTDYNEICLIFREVPFSWTREVRESKELCNDIREPETEPRPFEIEF